MTKVTILGEEPQKKELEPIEAVACLQSIDSKCNSDWIIVNNYNLKNRENLRIIKVNSYKNFDCIIIDEANNIFLGYFNDGIV